MRSYCSGWDGFFGFGIMRGGVADWGECIRIGEKGYKGWEEEGFVLEVQRGDPDGE